MYIVSPLIEVISPRIAKFILVGIIVTLAWLPLKMISHLKRMIIVSIEEICVS